MPPTNADILLVEDSPEDAEMTIRALKKVNLASHVVHVEDGQEALDFIFAEGAFSDRKNMPYPKVILLDIKMPRVDGIEVLRRIKQDEATRTIPVVIMTSSAADKDIITSYNLGVNSYVIKPVGFENFARSVGELGIYWMVTNRPPD